MAGQGPGGRLRRVVVRSVLVLVVGGAVLAPILYYATTVDVRPPQVERFSLTQHLPGDNAVALTTSSLEIDFSESVDHESAQRALVVQPAIAGAFSWSGSTMIFTPGARLPLETRFSVTLRPGISDLAGNRMGSGGPYSFETVGSPSVVATQPGTSAIDVSLDASISVTFSTLMDTASVQAALEIIPRTDVDLRWAGERLTIVPSDPLEADHQYLVVIGTGATDLAGTALADPLRLSFTTVPSGLEARAVLPQDTAQGIAVTTPIAVIFDRAIDPGSVNDRLLTLDPAVGGSLTLGPPGGAAGLADTAARVLRFTPSGPLPANTTFTVTLDPGLRGTDGARLTAPISWTFTTGAASTSLGNQIVYLSSRSGVANLWAMNPDGSNQHQLSSELSPITSYAVAPDGRSYVVGDGARLVEARADGSARRVLTESGSLEFDPAYAPDGSTIVFGRADAVTGRGLGLWTRPLGGGTAQLLVAPSAAGTPTPTASPSLGEGSSSPTPTPPNAVTVLRAPRYSPDGSSVAFVDAGGRIGILDLRSGSLTTAAFDAVAPPAWLPGSDAILVSGLPELISGAPGAGGVLTPGTPVPPLTPAGLRLAAGERAALRIVALAPGSSTTSDTGLVDGATLPAVAANGRVAYLVLDPGSLEGGELWVAASSTADSVELAPDRRALVTALSFGPQPRTLVVARVPVVTEPPPLPAPSASPVPAATPTVGPIPSPTASPGSDDLRSAAGIWLIDAATGDGRQLTSDGWLPRWLP